MEQPLTAQHVLPQALARNSNHLKRHSAGSPTARERLTTKRRSERAHLHSAIIEEHHSIPKDACSLK